MPPCIIAGLALKALIILLDLGSINASTLSSTLLFNWSVSVCPSLSKCKYEGRCKAMVYGLVPDLIT